MDVGSFPHQVTRLVYDTGQPYQEFRARYEKAVPEVDAARLAAFAERGAPWQEVVADADASAPHGFFIFWRLDTTPVMTLAGDPAQCTIYLMGNHVIAEQMYRHDPSVMLYVPLRTVIYVDAANRTRFVIDQPSTALGSFASAPISEVGIELDRKLGALLEALDVPRLRTHDRADRPTRPPLPPFTRDTAIEKVRLAEDAWNTRDPQRVAKAYTPDCHWRNRAEFIDGREEIVAFLTRKWTRELDYRLVKELWAFDQTRIAVRFAYEFHDDSGNWFRSYGNENWEFDEQGLMVVRHASINDLPIDEAERKYRWPLGRRPDDHPGLSDLGL